MNNPIDDLYLKTMAGQSIVMLPDNTKILNDIANNLYQKHNLDESEIDQLKKIIMICNVLYNRTDITVLPIEDGFYDLLLELYKTYDEHFQVGSAVVDIQNIIENDIDSPIKAVKPAISFLPEHERDEIHQDVYEQLSAVYPLKESDFIKKPVSFLQDSITKREHNTQHNHPDLVGTLDKTKFIFNQDAIDAGVFNDPNVKILERDFFQKHIKDGIINPNEIYGIICELKYDGISVEADCDFHVQSARTRGDTGIGVAADITPILYGYTFKRAKAMIGEKPIGVKFEAIMSKSNLNKFNQLRGRSYSNCRTAIVGLFGASDAYQFRDLITLVPLALDRNDVPSITNRMEEIQLLNTLFVSDGIPLKYCYFEGNVAELLYLIKAFHDEAVILRDELDFMYDGIVVSYADEAIRNKLGRVNYINKYSMAVKFNPLEKQTTFRGYTYEVGQNGNITPMIHYDTVEFMGTLHNKSTGSSLARFQQLQLKEGDFINVKYVNDVMPYVSRIECSHNRDNPNPVVKIIDHCPVCGTPLVVSDSGKTLNCPNIDCAGRSKQRMVNMLQKLNIKGFADASINALNISHLYEVENMTEEYLINTLGDADGRNFYGVIQSLFNDTWNDYDIMGAIGFTGIARKKWKNILSIVSIRELYDMYKSDPIGFESQFPVKYSSIGEVTSLVIAREFKFFERDIDFILRRIKLIESKNNNQEQGIQIRFTGCRNKQLCQLLSTFGIDIDEGSITKKTDILLVPYEGFSSKKTEKAMSYGTKIVPIQIFIDKLDKNNPGNISIDSF